MRYIRNNVVIAVQTIDGFGKNPGLYIGTEKPNMVWKVASFKSEESANEFMKWFEYMIGLPGAEPPKGVEGNAAD